MMLLVVVKLLSGFKLINEFVNNENINLDDFKKDFKKKYLIELIF